MGYVSSLEGILFIPLFGYRKHSALLGPVRASDFRLTKSKNCWSLERKLKHNYRVFSRKIQGVSLMFGGCLGWSWEMEYYMYDIVGESLFNCGCQEPCNSGSIIYSCLWQGTLLTFSLRSWSCDCRSIDRIRRVGWSQPTSKDVCCFFSELPVDIHADGCGRVVLSNLNVSFFIPCRSCHGYQNIDVSFITCGATR